MTSEAGLRASQEWFEVMIFDLDVSATIYEYDDDSEKEQALAHLARLAQAYMRGQGQIHSKRRAWRGRPLLTIEVDGRRWELGRRSSRVKYL